MVYFCARVDGWADAESTRSVKDHAVKEVRLSGSVKAGNADDSDRTTDRF